MLRTYQELILLPTFEARFEYLKLNGVPTMETFGGRRMLNQAFYSSPIWKKTRRQVIIRDNGCDLGIEDRPIIKPAKLFIHHLNPISIEQVENMDPAIFDLNNLITVSQNTHNAIHYGTEENLIPTKVHERSPGDTILW